MPTNKLALIAVSALAVLSLAACGSSSSSSSSSAPTSSSSASGSTPSAALSADARSAATGDIPDTQAFVVFTNRSAGYSMKYPEGWTQTGSGNNVTFRDKNNLVHVVIGHGAAPTPSSVTTALQALAQSEPGLRFKAPQVVDLGTSKAIKATYTTESAPNPVTGKRVTLMVDRYSLSSGGRVAVVDLGTPTGVDNVDAYKKMIQSFHWQ